MGKGDKRLSILLVVVIMSMVVVTGVACKGERFAVVNYAVFGEGNERIYTFDSLKGEMVETATTVADATILQVAVQLARGVMEISVVDRDNKVILHGAASPGYSSAVQGTFTAGTYRIIYKVHDTAQSGRVEVTFTNPTDD